MRRPERLAKCRGCERILSNRFNPRHACKFCGSDWLEIISKPTDGDWMEAEANEAELQMYDWMNTLKEEGLWGPGPSVAAFMLGCSRPMVDDLVRDGILERNDYSNLGHKLVVISLRSIVKAKATKLSTGSFTGRPPGRPYPA